jgi:general secretion pathway protein D
MKIPSYIRFTVSLVLLICLTSPIVALAGNDKEGKNHFKAGMKFEDAEQWDKAVEEFAMAIVNTPKNAEYRLHYQRSLFNASQMFMKSGNALVEQKDYKGAYNAFRKAYAYDSTNELAKAETERMLRLLEDLNNPDKDKKDDSSDTSKNPSLKLVQTAYQKRGVDDTVPQKLEKLRDIPFPSGVDLQYLIRELAKDLDLNVLFDEETFRQADRKVKIELKNVTAAKALDYLFLQTGLFFQKVGPRTIIVASQNRRQNFQQLVLRTYYLSNADPQDVAKVIQTAIPPQPGRTPTGVLTDKSTNSLTVRDTQENIQLIGKLIKSLDKDRSEVVMDVNIYEVSKSDLLQIGNQIGSDSSLQSLGGIDRGSTRSNTTSRSDSNPFTLGNLASGLANGLRLPVGNLQALQSKGSTKLLASTQVHAFNNEESTARIGQRVPVQTASVYGGGVQSQNGGRNDTFGQGYPVIQYEQVGLTLKFTPIVFPNQDVQVKMEIESKDVIAGKTPLTPEFTERSIKGTARIQNNRTLLLASVAQDTQSNSRSGLPLVSFLPVLGRLFSAPKSDNRQVDIVIAVTPRVLRAPVILDEDNEERPTGSLATPTSGSLEAMIVQEERDEQLAADRRLTNTANIQMPDQKPDSPAYVQAKADVEAPPTVATAPKIEMPKIENPLNLKPIETTTKTIDLTKTSDTTDKTNIEPIKPATVPQAGLKFFLPEITVMKAGEKAKVQILIESDASFNSAVLALGFDPKKIAVRKISYGEVFGKAMTEQEVKPYYNANGKTYANLSTETLTKIEGNDVLAYVEIEALADCKPELSFIPNMFTLINNESGQGFALTFGK